jgi:hypothetical protein
MRPLLQPIACAQVAKSDYGPRLLKPLSDFAPEYAKPLLLMAVIVVHRTDYALISNAESHLVTGRPLQPHASRDVDATRT